MVKADGGGYGIIVQISLYRRSMLFNQLKDHHAVLV
jgi:hypothetical protein